MATFKRKSGKFLKSNVHYRNIKTHTADKPAVENKADILCAACSRNCIRPRIYGMITVNKITQTLKQWTTAQRVAKMFKIVAYSAALVTAGTTTSVKTLVMKTSSRAENENSDYICASCTCLINI